MKERVIAVAAEYLGGQAAAFVERQCRAHLKIEPDRLGAEHMAALARWVGISASLVMPRERADAFRARIGELAGA